MSGELVINHPELIDQLKLLMAGKITVREYNVNVYEYLITDVEGLYRFVRRLDNKEKVDLREDLEHLEASGYPIARTDLLYYDFSQKRWIL